MKQIIKCEYNVPHTGAIATIQSMGISVIAKQIRNVLQHGDHVVEIEFKCKEDCMAYVLKHSNTLTVGNYMTYVRAGWGMA